jgi:hypothetical protein
MAVVLAGKRRGRRAEFTFVVFIISWPPGTL